jgi:hypothetical protein
MTKQSDLLRAYELCLRAEEAKRHLAPERLKTMKADGPWIEAVSAHSEAQQAFMEAALSFCRTIRSEGLSPAPRRAGSRQRS